MCQGIEQGARGTIHAGPSSMIQHFGRARMTFASCNDDGALAIARLAQEVRNLCHRISDRCSAWHRVARGLAILAIDIALFIPGELPSRLAREAILVSPRSFRDERLAGSPNPRKSIAFRDECRMDRGVDCLLLFDANSLVKRREPHQRFGNIGKAMWRHCIYGSEKRGFVFFVDFRIEETAES